MTAGRRVYRQVKQPDGTSKMVEIAAPKPLSSDLRFDGTFVSPVTGEVISNKRALDDHNKRNGVEQIIPGMDQDREARRADEHDKAFGKQAQHERIKDVIQAIEQGERNA